jgi:hypothetical protein
LFGFSFWVSLGGFVLEIKVLFGDELGAQIVERLFEIGNGFERGANLVGGQEK